MPTTEIVIAGAGSFMPETVVSNQTIVDFIGQKDPDWISRRLGVGERRFMAPFDKDGFPIQDTDELDMAEASAHKAIHSAGLRAEDVHGLYFVSCTSTVNRTHLSRAGFDLHKRLGLPNTCRLIQTDLGCGGFVAALGDAAELLRGSDRTTMLVVASNAPSKHFGGNLSAYLASEAWLSAYLFGDGAGAFVLRKQQGDGTAGILASYFAVDPTQPLMAYASKGSMPPVYLIDAMAVKMGYLQYSQTAIDELRKRYPFELSEVDRFYFHQANGRLFDALIDKLGIPPERAAKNVTRYGNTSAAATPILFSEDRQSGAVMDGELCLFCTAGAGAQYGALLVRV